MSRTYKSIIISSVPAEHEIQQILGRKNTKEGLFYLIKWKGFPRQSSSWQPINSLLHTIDFVRQYQRKLNNEKVDNIIDDQLYGWQNTKTYGKLPGKKKRIFKRHLIFTKAAKVESKTEVDGQMTKKNKKRNKNKIQNKNNKQQSQQLISSIPIYDFQDQQLQNFISEQDDIMYRDTKIALQNKGVKRYACSWDRPKQEEQEEAEQIPSSLNLTDLCQQQDQMIALQHLNPSYSCFSWPSSSPQRRFVRFEEPIQELNLMQNHTQLLCDSSFRITKIVKNNGQWFAEISKQKVCQGYAPVGVLRKTNKKLLQSFLNELLQK